jgi:very-short-patch-repair endonuclease
LSILSKNIEIQWVHKTKEFYVNKGYEFTNFGEYFIVDVSDLPQTSTYKIKVKCDVCGKERELELQYYNKNIKKHGFYTCGGACSKVKCEKTCLLKYGDKNYNNKEKCKKTCLERYGVDNSLKNIDIIEKRNKTNLEKFGYINVFQNENIKNKIKETLLKKYDVTHPSKCEIFREKRRITCIDKYGVINPMMCEEFKEKQKNTCIERYGTLFLHINPRFNKSSIYFFGLIERMTGLNIQHALKTEHEKRFKRYSVDGYIETLNVIIEWDENYHKNKKQIEKDIKRQLVLETEYGCDVFRINQSKNIKDIYTSVYKLCDILMIMKKQYRIS